MAVPVLHPDKLINLRATLTGVKPPPAGAPPVKPPAYINPNPEPGVPQGNLVDKLAYQLHDTRIRNHVVRLLGRNGV